MRQYPMKMYRNWRTICLMAGLVYVAMAASLTAQVVGRGQVSPAECERLIQDAQQTSVNTRLRSYVAACGTRAGVPLANALRQRATTVDTALLHNWVSNWMTLRDANVLSAAIDVATNRAATQVARTAAIQVLLSQYRPGSVVVERSWKNLLSKSQHRAGCVTHLLDVPQYQGASLPSDYAKRIAAALDQVSTESSAPAPLRSLASCVRLYLERDVPRYVNPAAVSARYSCDSLFWIRFRDTTRGAEIEYQAVGASRRYKLTLPPRDSGVLKLRDGSTLQIYVNGQLHQTVENEGKKCYGRLSPPPQ